jgi:hypothetical protein
MTKGRARGARNTRVKKPDDIKAVKPWRVVGFDTFAGELYPLSEHGTELECYRAAKEYLEELERTQPTEHSGGPDGIQDWVFVVTPTGHYVRYRQGTRNDGGDRR